MSKIWLHQEFQEVKIQSVLSLAISFLHFSPCPHIYLCAPPFLPEPTISLSTTRFLTIPFYFWLCSLSLTCPSIVYCVSPSWACLFISTYEPHLWLYPPISLNDPLIFDHALSGHFLLCLSISGCAPWLSLYSPSLNVELFLYMHPSLTVQPRN